PAYNYWLARYAVMAGDYQTPQTLLKQHPELVSVLNGLPQILDPAPQPKAPEIPYPENFYSYRHEIIPHDQLANLASHRQSFTKEQYAAYLTRIGNPVDPNAIDDATFSANLTGARFAIAAIVAWQTGNQYAADREFTLAAQSYAGTQSQVASYFQ